MNIRILDEAEQDLVDGFRFYDLQEEELGDYFLDSLSLRISTHFTYMPVYTPSTSDITGSSRNAFPSPSTTESMEK